MPPPPGREAPGQRARDKKSTERTTYPAMPQRVLRRGIFANNNEIPCEKCEQKMLLDWIEGCALILFCESSGIL